MKISLAEWPCGFGLRCAVGVKSLSSFYSGVRKARKDSGRAECPGYIPRAGRLQPRAPTLRRARQRNAAQDPIALDPDLLFLHNLGYENGISRNRKPGGGVTWTSANSKEGSRHRRARRRRSRKARRRPPRPSSRSPRQIAGGCRATRTRCSPTWLGSRPARGAPCAPRWRR